MNLAGFMDDEIELSCSYTTRSNYKNAYYYTSFITCTLAPELVLAMRIGTFGLFFFSGAGYNYLFSQYGRTRNTLFSAGIGVFPSHGIIRDVSLSVYNSFDNRFVHF